MTNTDFTHDANAKCWVEGANGHAEFPVQNLPLCVFGTPDGRVRGGVRIADAIMCLPASVDLLEGAAKEAAEAADADNLNALVAMGPKAMTALRQAVFKLLTEESEKQEVQNHLHPMTECTMHVPFDVKDYTDFYTGIHHAENIGSFFRPDNPLMPNYKHVPIGYHGRSSSIRVSGDAVKRPKGQKKPTEEGGAPGFSPSARLDYELEMAIWIGQGNDLGDPIDVAKAEDHIAGISILNDWSARDIQAWEYQPLGPFLAKNFHSSVSPWVVTMDALKPYRIAQPERPSGDPQPLEYLQHDTSAAAFDITMEVLLSTEKMREAGEGPHRVSTGTMEAMYWTAAQLIAHHSVGGCNLQPGDLLGTGTLTSGDEGGEGSLMELSANGKQPINLPNGEERTFLENGDEVIMVAYAEKDGFARIGLGECRAVIEG